MLAISKEQIVSWLLEREANARQIAADKPGNDRHGWVEDADHYFFAAKAIGQRVPLTGAQAMRVYENSPLIKGSMTFAAFERVLRVVEGVHRIERAD